MQRNQIHLSKKPLEHNQIFLRELYSTEELEDARKWFDKLDCRESAARQRDLDMTLDDFLELMDDSFLIVFQIGSPFSGKIRYCSSSIMKKSDHFVWVECPLNGRNYEVVRGIYQKVFGEDIESVPVPKGLEEYHRRHG
ncbi:hypothetical protein GOV12_01545 [Candidatus Pacearchaeota archaeon]|nr:hypothetical protein [Candidatus Pacearchaeota archaeon]